MSARQLELAAKRNALIAQSAAQREQLKVLAVDVRERLSGIDQGIEMVRAVARKPTIVAGAIAMISFIGPTRVLRAVTRSAMFVSAGRRLLHLWRDSKASRLTSRQQARNKSLV